MLLSKRIYIYDKLITKSPFTYCYIGTADNADVRIYLQGTKVKESTEVTCPLCTATLNLG